MSVNLIKVSVIVPIYNAGEKLVRCLDTIVNQTLRDIEIILVLDCPTDGSDVIAKKFAQQDSRIIILENTKNLHIGESRNRGIKIAKGEYLHFSDHDDYRELDMLEKLYRKAEETDADIVWCDWYLSFEKNERYMKQPDYDTPMEALKGILSGAMKYNVWNKLVKRSLHVENQIRFPEGYGMGEDMTMIRLFACAQKVAYLPEALQGTTFYECSDQGYEAVQKAWLKKLKEENKEE